MSQIVTRKSHVAEDKEKRQTENPVKDMKKKLAANAEKEKQAAEKSMEKSAPNEKQGETSDKNADKKEKDKSIERVDKKEKDKITEKVDKKEKDKNAEKVEKKEKDKVNDKVDKKEVKTLEKNEKIVERSPEKKDKNDKKETPVEKERRNSKDKAAKPGHSEEKKKLDEKPKQNGAKALNGEQNGDTVSSEDEDLDIERDEMFPELTYEDSDFEGFEVPTPEGLPSRSYTRRSQVKATRTPETPRPASDKQPESGVDDSKEKKDALNSPATDRRLRSSDSPKPDKKDAKKSESPKKAEEKREKEGDATIEIAVEAEENEGEARKPDTNYSRSRVKVSPYRRSLRLADVTISSTAANYTGNNTTMEMDITETSTLAMDDAPESPYLAGLRNIRGRRSYKPLKEMNLRNLAVNRSTRSTASTSGIESLRPTGTVVGRKRKPENDAVRMDGEDEAGPGPVGDTKRPRLLYRFTRPFRTFSTAQRHAEIVGINTDLPLTAPVACAAGPFDPEAIKPETGAEATTLMSPPAALPELSAQDRQMDSRRCIVM